MYLKKSETKKLYIFKRQGHDANKSEVVSIIFLLTFDVKLPSICPPTSCSQLKQQAVFVLFFFSIRLNYCCTYSVHIVLNSIKFCNIVRLFSGKICIVTVCGNSLYNLSRQAECHGKRKKPVCRHYFNMQPALP